MSDLDDVDHYSWRQVYVACDVDTRAHEDRYPLPPEESADDSDQADSNAERAETKAAGAI